MKMIVAAAAVAALSLGATAQAKTYKLGTLKSGKTSSSSTINDVNSSKTTAAVFTDDFTFNVKSPLEDFTTAAITESETPSGMFKGPFEITSADITLYSGAVGKGTELTTSGFFDPQTQRTPTISDELTKGSYYIQTVVDVPKGDTGSFTVTATPVSAAPEPASWVLMIGGIGVVGSVLRMSRRNSWAAYAA